MSFVGKSVERKDALDKVLGTAQYIDDMHFDNMLIAKGVYSKETCGRIISINISEAKKVKGVVKIITAKDIPGENLVPIVRKDMPYMAEDMVRYYGEPVAYVAAETQEAAEEGARLVKVQYEPLTPVLSIEESIREDAPKIHPHGNIHKYYKIRKGDVAKGFKEADIIIENEYRTPHQEHSYLETNGMIGVPSHDGAITVYGSLQCPFYVQEGVANILRLPLNKVRIIQTVTGGGFGGKEDIPSLYAGNVALMAFLTGRPVKLVLTREEDFLTSTKRHPSLIKYKTGAKKDGTITGIEVTFYMDGGAYSTLSPIVLWRGLIHSSGPYRCEHVKIDGYAVATNRVHCGAFRGFGQPQLILAHEAQMDILAEKLNIDPVEIRRKNAFQVGDATATGQKLETSVGLLDTINETWKKSEWQQKKILYEQDKGNKRRGIGISSSFYGVSLGAGGRKYEKSGAYVEINKDCSINVAVGTTEMGQGMKTVLSQIAADALGVTYEDIYILETDSTRVPDSGPTVASRSTVMSGNAIKDACRQLRERLEKVAENMLKIPAKVLIWDNGHIYFKQNPSVKITFKELIEEALHQDVHLSAQGWFVAPYTTFDEETGQGWCYFTYVYSTNIAEVEVDMTTGTVKVLKVTAAHDVGKAINPTLVEGQIQGGIVQGLGYALTEGLIYDKSGKMINPNFSTYIIPTAVDSTVIEPIIVEHIYPDGPYGAKGFGELPILGVAPAIANAVSHATGVRIKELPVTPEKLYKAMRVKSEK